jgi:hypothetical protein
MSRLINNIRFTQRRPVAAVFFLRGRYTKYDKEVHICGLK